MAGTSRLWPKRKWRTLAAITVIATCSDAVATKPPDQAFNATRRLTVIELAGPDHMAIDSAYKLRSNIAQTLEPGKYAFTPEVSRFLARFKHYPMVSQSPLVELPDVIVVMHGQLVNKIRSPADYNNAAIAARTRLGLNSAQSVAFMRILIARHDVDGAAQHRRGDGTRIKNHAGFDSLTANLYSPILEPIAPSLLPDTSSAPWWQSWRSGIFGAVQKNSKRGAFPVLSPMLSPPCPVKTGYKGRPPEKCDAMEVWIASSGGTGTNSM